jgi:hypothetical protein
MDDQHQHDDMTAYDRASGQVLEAGAKSVFELQSGQEALEDDQAGEGGEGLILELHFWDLMDFTVNLRSAIFHFRWSPLGLVLFNVQSILR